MNVSNIKPHTLLHEVGVQPGSVIHVQDSRLIKSNTSMSFSSSDSKTTKEIAQFVRKDFTSSRTARASFLAMQ